jgi:hypothetical protein
VYRRGFNRPEIKEISNAKSRYDTPLISETRAGGFCVYRCGFNRPVIKAISNPVSDTNAYCPTAQKAAQYLREL